MTKGGMMINTDNYIKSHELAWNAGWKAALDSKRESSETCNHYVHSNEWQPLTVEKSWKFCPGCGARP